MSVTSCKNCEKRLPDRAKFCPSCGQSVRQVSRPWMDFTRETLPELVDIDGRALRSLRLLQTRPGFLSREYIDGRRVSYTSPVRMYLVISLVFFFVLPLILPEADSASSSREVAVDLYSQAMFLLLPVFALLLKLFFRRAYYLDHLVFTVHLFSALYFVFGVMLAFETLADRYLAFLFLQVLMLVYMVGYFIVALHTFYRQSWFKSALKFLGLLLVFLPLMGFVIELASHSD
jgi:RNA polymerase subunit RPABC4/transcription elongation factor Spt4